VTPPVTLTEDNAIVLLTVTLTKTDESTVTASRTLKVDWKNLTTYDQMGAGTETAPFLLYNATQLANLAATVNVGTNTEGEMKGIYFKMMDNIDLSSVCGDGTNGAVNASWTPIGKSNNSNGGAPFFAGIFDGNGYSVTGLYVNASLGGYKGLFGATTSTSVIKNLSVSGKVRGISLVGGIVGANNKGIISGCSSSVEVNGSSFVGGITGNNDSGSITACYNTGNVAGSSSVGGITGNNDSGSITACYNTGNVAGSSSVGGIAGQNNSGSITACYNTGTVTGNNGIVGLNNSGTFAACYFLFGTEGMGGGTPTGVSLVDNISALNNKVGDMNSAITTWNTGNPTKLCNFQFVVGTDKTTDVPTLAPGAPTVP